jgi:methylmalonyl-CoA mutase N-terminal domain/subunit
VPPLEILRVSHDVEVDQRTALAARRADRDQAAVDAALARVRDAARGDANLIEPLLDAARAEATLGEMCQLLVSEWGAYTEPPKI